MDQHRISLTYRANRADELCATSVLRHNRVDIGQLILSPFAEHNFNIELAFKACSDGVPAQTN